MSAQPTRRTFNEWLDAKKMTTDQVMRNRAGVSAEVLYPTFGLRLFALEDADVQEACFQIANDWLIDYCKVAPGRLVGIPMISLYNLKNAVKELERCKKAGLVGSLIWQVPPDHLPGRGRRRGDGAHPNPIREPHSHAQPGVLEEVAPMDRAARGAHDLVHPRMGHRSYREHHVVGRPGARNWRPR